MLHIVPEAVEVPARCAVSQSTTGPFLDTQITIPRHGRLYLSLPWLNSVAAGLGWVPAPELAEALTELDASLRAQQALEARVERFDEDVQNVADAMVAFLGAVKAHTDVADEVVDAISDVEALAGRVAALETPA